MSFQKFKEEDNPKHSDFFKYREYPVRNIKILNTSQVNSSDDLKLLIKA
jgi:hypothetical protein